MRRLGDRTAIGITITALVAYDVARSTVIPDAAHMATNLAMTGVVALIGRAAALTAADVGVARSTMRAGARIGAVAAAIVGVAVGVAVVVAGTTSGFVQDRIDMSVGHVLFQVLVEIPLATVLFEELAYRGVLAALFHRLWSPWAAVTVTSLLFGLWHVPPAWTDGVPILAGTVVATTAAGVVLQLMRDRTGSLVAPMLAHWATNGLALAVVYAVASRLVSG